MNTFENQYNQKQLELAIFYVQQQIGYLIKTNNDREGSEWKCIPEYRTWLVQLSIWLGQFTCYYYGGEKPKGFAEFMRGLHRYNDCEIVNYTQTTWKYFNRFVQSLGNRDMEHAFLLLIDYFDVEEDYEKFFE